MLVGLEACLWSFSCKTCTRLRAQKALLQALACLLYRRLSHADGRMSIRPFGRAYDDAQLDPEE